MFNSNEVKFKIYDIKWDKDGDKVKLPKSILLSKEQFVEAECADELDDMISDYITNLVGYCHNGFNLREVIIKDNKEFEVCYIITDENEISLEKYNLEQEAIDEVNNNYDKALVKLVVFNKTTNIDDRQELYRETIYSVDNEYDLVDYDKRAIEEEYGLEDGELDGCSIREAEELVGEEEGALDRFLL